MATLDWRDGGPRWRRPVFRRGRGRTHSRRRPMSAKKGADGRDTKTGRFEKGKTGNPKGRPRKAPTVDQAILGALNEKVQIKGNRGPKRVTKLVAAAMQMANKSA